MRPTKRCIARSTSSREIGIGADECVGHREPESDHDPERDQERPRRNRDRRALVSGDDAQIGLESDDDQEDDHTEPGEPENDRPDRGLAEDPIEALRGQPAEHGRA